MARNLLEIQEVALIVAAFGEGGVKRSTLASTLARLHATDHLKALAIDDDPDVNSASALDLPAELLASNHTIHTIAEDRKLIEARRGAKVRGFAPIFQLDCRVPRITEHCGQATPARSSLCSELPSALAAVALARKVFFTNPW
jgi:CO dehydrogenase nickel-insertion accessory protein CooC1